MTSLTWRPHAGLLPFRARVGSAAGLGLAGAGWGRAGGHVRLCRCPQGLRGPLWRSLDQPWAPGRGLFGQLWGRADLDEKQPKVVAQFAVPLPWTGHHH